MSSHHEKSAPPPPTTIQSGITTLRGKLGYFDSPRRSRGRPRKYPLTSYVPVAPETSDGAQFEDDDEEEVVAEEPTDGVFYQEQQIVEMDQKDDEELKIKQIQQQKMLIVTPMGQRSRGKGRPPRKPFFAASTRVSPPSQPPKLDYDDEPHEGTSTESAPSVVEETSKNVSRAGRARQPTRKILEMERQQSTRHSQSETKADAEPPQHEASKQRAEAEKPPSEDEPELEKQPMTPREEAEQAAYEEAQPGPEQHQQEQLKSQQQVEQRIEKEPEEHEQLLEPVEPIKDTHTAHEEHVEQEESGGGREREESSTLPPPPPPPPSPPPPLPSKAIRDDRPPPAPKNLANRANMRGRPGTSIHMVPPHRRPIPKDLMPPGFPHSRKPSVPPQQMTPKEREILLRRVRENDVEKRAGTQHQPSHHGPSSSHAHQQPPPRMVIAEHDQEASQSSESTKEKTSGSAPPMPSKMSSRKREAGLDLPSEHMPKMKARHVARAGIVPTVAYEAAKVYEMDMETAEDDIIMHNPIDEGDGPSEMMAMEANYEKRAVPHKQYIEVEENGVNVVYEVHTDDDLVNRASDEMIMDETGTQYVIRDENDLDKNPEDDMEHHAQGISKADTIADDEDDMPPQLVPEEVQDDEVVQEVERRQQELVSHQKKPDDDGQQMSLLNIDVSMMETGENFRLSSPGGRAHLVQLARDEHGNAIFIDEQGIVVELITDNGQLVEPSTVINEEAAREAAEASQRDEHDENEPNRVDPGASPSHEQPSCDLRNVEFNFLDSRNICCGLCGEIVVYDTLVSEHLPTMHPEFLQPGVELEEVPYENWLKKRLRQEVKNMENGFRHYDDGAGASGQFSSNVRLFSRGLRQLRKVSQIRVNPNEMSMPQLEMALRRKMIEKLGRKVPVTLVDRFHARCDVCQAVVSLNKKFEIIHLVRHFNAWHPAEHRCTNAWKVEQSPSRGTKILSLHDFAVVDTDSEQNNLQCIWCGMFMDKAAIGMHFSEVHGEQVEVPKCSLCLQEMVLSARLIEKYGEDFGISHPDEFHVASERLNNKYNNEKALDKAIEKYLKRIRTGTLDDAIDDDDDDDDDAEVKLNTTNSQQTFGRRNRMKRKFVKPCFRQICPTNSEYFEAFSACEWKCKLCARPVYGAVISAGAIKHYKEFHPAEMESMQYELVKARLERIGDGSMEFVHPQLVECLICNLTYALHKPFNICRAIRHLRLKHPEVMPETSGKPISGANIDERSEAERKKDEHKIRLGELITDPVQLERFRREHDVEFDKVQVIYGAKPNNEPSYILLAENEHVDEKTAQAIGEIMVVDDDKPAHEKPMVAKIKDEPIDEMFELMDERAFTIPTAAATATTTAAPNQMETAETFHQQQMQQRAEELMRTEPVEYEIGYPDGGNVVLQDVEPETNYEIIQHSQFDGDRVQYMTEEELQDAHARGELQIEYIDQQDDVLDFEFQ
ncbi:unnamed protein product [Caenorhabditis bovis]|uniref:Uncharacterized protein n=1 Tax=Caenorhabditis bovis TaxID=2654633 RepID=A0A8S1EYX9_9PELO|nr:unnamed protein product [Caenorhabditis bovis]